MIVQSIGVTAFTSVALKEQWPGVGKAAETVSSLDHWQSGVCIHMGRKESMCHVTISVTPCRQLLYISVSAVAQVSHVQPQRSKSELPVLWPQLCLAAQWHWLWWPGEGCRHDLPAAHVYGQTHVAGTCAAASHVCKTLAAAGSVLLLKPNRPCKSSMGLSPCTLYQSKYHMLCSEMWALHRLATGACLWMACLRTV